MRSPESPTSAPAALLVEPLPARHGDCILVQWPDGDRTARMLVDAGPATAYDGISQRLRELGDARVDVLVLSHIDADHIEGVILLVNDRDVALRVDDVWYNGAAQLTDELGAVQGEILGHIIRTRQLPWNRAFGGGTVYAAGGTALPVVDLLGGLRVTVLAPSGDALTRLRDEWDVACRKAGIVSGSVDDVVKALMARPKLSPRKSYLAREPEPDVAQLAAARTGTDASAPNASSIVLLLEHDGDRTLLAGDATPAELLLGVRRWLSEHHENSLPLATFKLPHHGSAKNITAELVRLLPARRYLVSTDGSYFKHPDDTAIATVLQHGPRGLELVFNYDNPRNRRWDGERLRQRFGHTVTFASNTQSSTGLPPVRLPADRLRRG